jgi:N utilization substance protein A
MVSEFVSAINQIAAERGINPTEVFQALESAILVAYKKEHFKDEYRRDFDEEEDDEEGKKLGENLSVELDQNTGEFKLFATKEVVDKVEDPEMEISLSEAEYISSNIEIGDSIQIEMPAEDLGRIAAQTAKQVILQKIRESEKTAILSEFEGKVGEVFTALMQRMQKGSAIFEIGKATAMMPVEEQVSNEFYRIGERYKVLLKSIEDSEVIVSRADPKFLVELFKLEVPEIESGVVEIKAVAREAGSRSKIAVVSHQDGVDPIGSCVGQRGIRIANIMNELGEEKIDIIEWSEDEEEFVANSLSPAKIESVKIDENTAVVTTEADQLSLAIGKEGQNVRLAWKLTGYKIDILGPDGESQVEEEEIEESVEEKKVESAEEKEVNELDEALAKKLEKAGKTEEEVKGWTVDQLTELDGIGKVTAEKIAKVLA